MVRHGRGAMSLDPAAAAAAALHRLAASPGPKRPPLPNLWTAAAGLGRPAELALLSAALASGPDPGLGTVFTANAVAKPRAGFVDLFVQAYDRAAAKGSSKLPAPFALAKALKLSPVAEVLLSLALVDSDQPDVAQSAAAAAAKGLPALLAAYARPEERLSDTGLEEASIDVLHHLLVAAPAHGVPDDLRDQFARFPLPITRLCWVFGVTGVTPCQRPCAELPRRGDPAPAAALAQGRRWAPGRRHVPPPQVHHRQPRPPDTGTVSVVRRTYSESHLDIQV